MADVSVMQQFTSAAAVGEMVSTQRERQSLLSILTTIQVYREQEARDQTALGTDVSFESENLRAGER